MATDSDNKVFVDDVEKEAGDKFPISVPDEDHNDSPEMREVLDGDAVSDDDDDSIGNKL